MHERIDYIFACVNNAAFYFFGQIVSGQKRHVGGDDYMQIDMQVGTYVTGAESVNADDVRAGECDVL